MKEETVEVLVRITKKDFEELQSNYVWWGKHGEYIKKGKPLPKEHGDLKDVQDIINRINLNYNNQQSIDAYSLKDMIATTQTVIPANKEIDG